MPHKLAVIGSVGGTVRAGPAILSGAFEAERKAAPKHIINVGYPGLCSIEQHI